MSQLPLIIVNPQSAAGTTGERWAAMASDLRTHFGAFEVAFTARWGDARQIAQREAQDGREFLIACGGDGTINEVANGILDSQCDVELGVLPSGTGGDFRRTLEMPTNTSDAARALKQGTTRSIDAGRVTYTNYNGERESRYFLGVSSTGMAGKVLEKVKDENSSWAGAPASRWFGGKLSFMAASLTTALQFQKPTLLFQVEGYDERRATIINFCVCNARYFGGGMFIAPNAKLDDAHLDLVIIGDIERTRIIANIHKLYTGTHLDLEGVQHSLIKRVSVQSVDASERVMIETDGEIVGYLPAEYEIVPRALRVRCAN